MAAFIEAWPTGDASDLAPFFSDDAVYHNIPLEAVNGKEAIRSTLEGFMDMCGSVDVEVVGPESTPEAFRVLTPCSQ